MKPDDMRLRDGFLAFGQEMRRVIEDLPRADSGPAIAGCPTTYGEGLVHGAMGFCAFFDAKGAFVPLETLWAFCGTPDRRSPADWMRERPEEAGDARTVRGVYTLGTWKAADLYLAWVEPETTAVKAALLVQGFRGKLPPAMQGWFDAAPIPEGMAGTVRSISRSERPDWGRS
jgi:hypothetical protein